MKIFLAFGDRNSLSHDTAGYLKVFFDGLFGGQLDSFLASRDVAAGAAWRDELMRTIGKVDWGVLCLTKECRERPWVMFEAGALTRVTDQGDSGPRVCPLVIEFSSGSLDGPLATFQAKELTSEDEQRSMHDLRSLAEDLNNSPETPMLSEAMFNLQFTAHWNLFWENFVNAKRALPVKSEEANGDELVPDNSELMAAVRRGFMEIVDRLDVGLKLTQRVSCPYCDRSQMVNIGFGSGRTNQHTCVECGSKFNLHNFHNKQINVRRLSAEPADTVAEMEHHEVRCPSCTAMIAVQILGRAGETKGVECGQCGVKFSIHFGSNRSVFVGGQPTTSAEATELQESVEASLRRGKVWVRPSNLKVLTDLVMEVEEAADEPLCATELQRLMLDRRDSEKTDTALMELSRHQVLGFVKLCVRGRGFPPAGDGVEAVKFRDPHGQPSEEGLLRAMLVAMVGYARRHTVLDDRGIGEELIGLYEPEVGEKAALFVQEGFTRDEEGGGAAGAEVPEPVGDEGDGSDAGEEKFVETVPKLE